MVIKRAKRRNVLWTVVVGLAVTGFSSWKAYQRPAAYAAPQTPSKSLPAIPPKVDYQNVRFTTPTANGSGGITGPMIFPGEAGAPADTVSRAEYDKAVHSLISKSIP